jgi:prevent-host-death family protein
MNTIAFYEARTRFSELLDQVGRGQTILITRHGKPAAMLTPPHDKKQDVKEVIAELRAYSKRQRRSLGKRTARDFINEGRR